MAKLFNRSLPESMVAHHKTLRSADKEEISKIESPNNKILRQQRKLEKRQRQRLLKRNLNQDDILQVGSLHDGGTMFKTAVNDSPFYNNNCTDNDHNIDDYTNNNTNVLNSNDNDNSANNNTLSNSHKKNLNIDFYYGYSPIQILIKF
ncbi:uncharacterized protein ASCRUDRAFT_71527 [Ascoidea rubescens DSM 1968]|uniref:Uncharacterized protein n=1 Tax=Ascoidea rubescens DSM 1968 TaxID=1344418 RepID=A0A1D2VDM8_9ASCO|nr:hypothetical protein ASCRUDRAFT_71527 [Ascoidea rubescens DSM 1968]ODV59567.1 hypothetical protein ASCRUDRAFT_71527 [Ascoidea rubescens DSM 1968]